MSLTSGLSDWLAAQGIWCPEGDGDTLRTAAAAWTAMGTAINDIGVTLTAAATTLAGTTTGAGTSAFSTYWESWSGPAGYLAVSAAYCSSLATALSGFATDVDIAGAAVLEGIEWAITQSNLTGGTPFTPGVVPDAVPAGVSPAAIAELRTAIEEFAATLGAAAAAQAASAGVTAIDPTAPPATPTAPVTTTTTATAITATPLTQAPDLSQVGVLAAAPDLGSLAKTALDFGAGQGTVLAPDGSPVALPAAAPLPTAAELTDPTGGAPLDWSSPVVPTTAIPAASTVPSSLPLSSVARPTALMTAALGIGKAVRSAAHAVSSHDALGAAGAGGGGGGSFSVPPLAKIPTSKFSAGAPITVPPPSAATLAAEKSAADVAKLAAGKSSGSMPFMPMGMGGAGVGGGGDEQDEARRRKRRI